ncbi:hypothetical protein [Marinagarivorans cellulosilyticus]|uniref:hypothetical protein n=1 Tax=Marinagarivorans cellulosilyticus TaxID=2721545 RepID=UPI001F2F5D9B|nr:hypothetical protein [Marinagarivorans cellulosilyticus]
MVILVAIIFFGVPWFQVQCGEALLELGRYLGWYSIIELGYDLRAGDVMLEAIFSTPFIPLMLFMLRIAWSTGEVHFWSRALNQR